MYPARPSSVESKQTNSTITLTWKQPQPRGELPINYSIKCLSSPSEICDARLSTRHIQWTSNRDYKFKDLLPYTIYEFEICSNNKVSLSNSKNGGCQKFKAKTEAGGTSITMFFFFFIARLVSLNFNSFLIK